MQRRKFIQALAATGIGTAALHRAIAVQAAGDTPLYVTQEYKEQPSFELEISQKMVEDACWVVGATLTPKQSKRLAATLQRELKSQQRFRETELPASTSPAIFFQPLNPPFPVPAADREVPIFHNETVDLPKQEEEIAFLPVWKLATLIRNKKVSSTFITKLYLKRLKQFGDSLNCVVNLTEDLALKQARQADEELAAGKYRGPLHGIPWGAKDLIAVKGYPTTWGIPQLKDRELLEHATVVKRLEEAGAVLVAKLSLGAIAMGDKWYQGVTRNPWDRRQGSSGSSAGSASATAAGLVGFSLGSETLGSILSPSQRCGTTGFRPTFGRVSRHGCMPLSWTMDKIGPITRCVQDAALVFGAIHGKDPNDPTTDSYSQKFLSKEDLKNLTVGYTKGGRKVEKRADLQILTKLGVKLIPIEIPRVPFLTQMLHTIDVEGAAVFQKMLNANQIEGWNSWPDSFHRGQFVSAIDYLKVMRLRRRLMERTEEVFEKVDALINARDIFVTNLTGNPSITLPRKIHRRKGRVFIQNDVLSGRNFQDANLLSLAHYYQMHVKGHLHNPTMDFPPEPSLSQHND